MSLINILLIILIIIALAATAFLARWIPYRERRSLMINLGFSEFKFPGSYIANKIRRLLNEPIRKKNIFTISAEGAQFLIIFPSLPSPLKQTEFFLLTVISEKMTLPRFTLTPKLNVTNRLDSIMNKTMDQVAQLEASEKNLHKIEISTYPELNKRFVLLGENRDSVTMLFTIERSKKFAQIKDGFELNANSDLFTLKMDSSNYSASSETDKIRKALALARRIYRILKN